MFFVNYALSQIGWDKATYNSAIGDSVANPITRRCQSRQAPNALNKAQLQMLNVLRLLKPTLVTNGFLNQRLDDTFLLNYLNAIIKKCIYVYAYHFELLGFYC